MCCDPHRAQAVMCSPTPTLPPPFTCVCRYVRIFQIILMAFVVATCYINVGKSTLDDGECSHSRRQVGAASWRAALGWPCLAGLATLQLLSS